MEWQAILALVVAVPVILFPVAFVWYLTIGGIVARHTDVQAAILAQPPTGAKRQFLNPRRVRFRTTPPLFFPTSAACQSPSLRR